MTKKEMEIKVEELLTKEFAYTRSINEIESTYKTTSEQKTLQAALKESLDDTVKDVLKAKLESFNADGLTFNDLNEICLTHGYGLAEIVKNGFSKLRGGDMYRRKELQKQIREFLPDDPEKVKELKAELIKAEDILIESP